MPAGLGASCFGVTVVYQATSRTPESRTASLVSTSLRCFFFTHVLRAVPRRVQAGLEVSMGDVIARHSPMRDRFATLSVVAGSRRGSVLGRLSTCLRKGGGGCTRCATENSARVPRGSQVLRQHTDAHQTIQCSFREVLLGKQLARNKQDSSNRVVSSVRCLVVDDAHTRASQTVAFSLSTRCGGLYSLPVVVVFSLLGVLWWVVAVALLMYSTYYQRTRLRKCLTVTTQQRTHKHWPGFSFLW